MASACTRTTVMLIAIFASLHLMGLNDAAGIDIQPNSFSEIFGQDVQISCSASGLQNDAQEIFLIQIGKKGERPLAKIHPDSSATIVNGDVTRNSSSSSSTHYYYNAVGNIDQQDLSQCFLNVTLLKPTNDWADAYTCTVYYKDVNSGHLVDHVSQADLSVITTEKILGALVQDVQKAMKNLKDSNTAALSGSIEDLKTRMSAMEKAMSVEQSKPKPTEKKDDCRIRGFMGICIL